MPRLKGLHLQKLYRPDRNVDFKNLKPVTSRAIDWQLIARNYDQIVKHAAALRFGTADADAIMRRFTRKSTENGIGQLMAQGPIPKRTRYAVFARETLA
jgi:TnpA family transposase